VLALSSRGAAAQERRRHETTETVRKKLNGEIKIGYEPAGVEGTLAAE